MFSLISADRLTRHLKHIVAKCLSLRLVSIMQCRQFAFVIGVGRSSHVAVHYSLHLLSLVRSKVELSVCYRVRLELSEFIAKAGVVSS